jgi:filamentous hemagglutinin family protein
MLAYAATVLAVGAMAAEPAQADPRPAADGTGTRVDRQGNRFDITGGRRSRDGDNLFHSFRQFGLNADQIANFISNPSIQNILGRINGGDPSIINGLIQVTGGHSNLYLMNPAGILFGPNASLNIPASFAATTATGIGFENGWFNAVGENNYADLVGTPNAFVFNSAELGSIVNAGQLAVSDGQNLSLVGGTVVNTGSLTAPGGNVTVTAVPAAEANGVPIVRIAQAGNLLSLDIQPAEPGMTGLPSEFTIASLPQLLTGGNLDSATGLTVNEQGQVVLTGSDVQIPAEAGTTILSGSVDVSGTSATAPVGGAVQVLGDRVGLLSASVNASGTTGGGTVLIGGDYQGSGTIPNADRTYVSQDSAINADNLVEGNGGRVIVWADQATQFYGSISAQGGDSSGNGGFVEISGRDNLAFNGSVDVTAANGASGTVLFDPDRIRIVDVGADDAQLSDGAILFADPPAEMTISQAALEGLAGNITLQARDRILVETSDAAGSPTQNLDFLAGPGETVTLETESGILFGGNSNVRAITTRGGNLNIYGGTNGTIQTDGGDLVFDARSGPVSLFLVDVQGSNESAVLSTVPLSDRNPAISSPSPEDISNIDLTRSGGSISLVLPNTPQTFVIGNLDSRGGVNGGDITIEATNGNNAEGTFFFSSINAGSIDPFNNTGSGGDVNITVTNNRNSAPGGIRLSLNALVDTHAEGGGNGGSVTLQTVDNCPGGSCAGLSNQVDSRITAVGGINTSSGSSFSPGSGLAGDIRIEETAGIALSIVGLGGNITAEGAPGSGNMTLTGSQINLPSQLPIDGLASDSFRLAGQLAIQPLTPTQPIFIGGTGAGVSITREQLRNIAVLPSFNNPLDFNTGTPLPNQVSGGIFIGRPDGAGEITLVEPVQLNSNVTIVANGATLNGTNVDTTYSFTGSNTGTITGFINPSIVTSPPITLTDLTFQGIGRINAGNANDTFVFPNETTTFAGSIDGGGGNNILNFSTFTAGIDADLNRSGAVGDATVRLRDNPTASPIIAGESLNISSVIGGSGNDLLIGNAADNILIGGNGDDTIEGRDGNDVISGGRGNNILSGGNGLDRVVEGDRVLGGVPRDAEAISLINRDLTFTTSGVSETTTLNADIEAVTLIGGDSDNTFTVDGWNGVDLTLLGNSGNDTFTTLNITGRVDIDGGIGSDTYRPSLSGTGVTNISDTGVDAVDALGNPVVDRLEISGTVNNDTFNISTGQISLVGGGQSLSFQGIEAQAVNGLQGDDTFNISNLTNIGGAISVNGGDGADTFIVSNNISGIANLDGGAGTDQIIVQLNTANAGTTNVLNSGDTDVLTINGTSTTDQIVLSTRQFEVIPGQISTGQVALSTETVNFGAGASVTVDARGGNDTFRLAGDGTPTPAQFSGNLIGGDGTDTLDYSGYSTSVNVDLTSGVATGLTQAIGPGEIQGVTGSAFDDTLTGDANANALDGGAGNDTLNGGAGDDTLTGGAGTDTFIGGAGFDRVVEERDADFTLTDTSLTIGADPTEDLNSDVESVTLIGGEGNNRFTVAGSSRADVSLQGRGGDDTFTITSNTGIVNANGGIGADTYNVSLDGSGTTNIDDTGAAAATDTLNLTGTAADDQIEVIAGQARLLNGGQTVTTQGIEARSIAGSAGNDTFTIRDVSDTIDVNGNDGNDTFTVSNVSGTVNANGNDGDDTFTISTVSGTVNATGGDDSDSYTVGFSGTGSGTTNVRDAGATGTDTLTVNGTAVADQFALTTGQVTRGNETVNYSGIESQTVNGGAGRDTFTVSNFNDNATLDGGPGSDTYTVNLTGTGNGTTTVADSGTQGEDTLTIAGTNANDRFALTTGAVTLGNETVNNSGAENLAVNAAGGQDTIAVNGAIEQQGDLSLRAERITSTTAGTLTSGGETGIDLRANTIDLAAAVQANGSGSVEAIAPNSLSVGDVTAGSNITLRSNDGTVSSGDLTSSRRSGQVDVTANGQIRIGNITAPGGVTLDSETGGITAGAIDSSAGSVDVTANGQIRTGNITAPGGVTLDSETGGITAGAIDSSAGSGGVNLDAENNIRVASISTGGGAIEARTNRLFLATGGISTPSGITSISTEGGDLFIEYNGRRERLNTFRVGNASRSGTEGAIDTGATALRGRSIPGARFQQGNLTIINLDPFVPPDPPEERPSLSDLDNPEVIDRRPAAHSAICPAVDDDTAALRVDEARASSPDQPVTSPTEPTIDATAAIPTCVPTEPILQVEEDAVGTE